jgi:hypothetical protein
VRHVFSSLVLHTLPTLVAGSLFLLVSAPASASPELSSLAASRAGKIVVVTWRSPHAADVLGFDVYRQDGAGRVRLNGRLISDPGAFGGSYRFVDDQAPVKATRYWVQAVHSGGARTWLGSAAAEHAIP